MDGVCACVLRASGPRSGRRRLGAPGSSSQRPQVPHLWVLGPGRPGGWPASAPTPVSPQRDPSLLLSLCFAVGPGHGGGERLVAQRAVTVDLTLGNSAHVTHCRRPPRPGWDAPQPPLASVTGNPEKGGRADWAGGSLGAAAAEPPPSQGKFWPGLVGGVGFRSCPCDFRLTSELLQKCVVPLERLRTLEKVQREGGVRGPMLQGRCRLVLSTSLRGRARV